VRRRRETLAATFALSSIAVLLLLALNMKAQQSAGPQNPYPEVPLNLAEHPAPVQPIPYSHKTHLALGLQCPICHTNPAPGNLMTFPAATTCMSCHISVAKNNPAIEKLTSLAKSPQPIPWVRVYAITPGVNWTHRKHLDAGTRCETCHGQVAQMDVISQTTSIAAMGVCINCHKMHNAPTVCATCHSWPAS
jgi:hypothetical protein